MHLTYGDQSPEFQAWLDSQGFEERRALTLQEILKVVRVLAENSGGTEPPTTPTSET